MKRLTNCVVVLAFLFGMAEFTLADVVVPKDKNPRKDQASRSMIPMTIAPSRDIREAKLEIPRSVLSQFSAQIDGDGTEQIGATTTTFTQANTQTAIAGAFLSLAFVFGGVWLVRSRKQPGQLTRVHLGIAILALCAASAGIAYANAGPPPVARSLTSKILIQDAKWYGAYGEVRVVVTDNGSSSVRLLLPMPKDDK